MPTHQVTINIITSVRYQEHTSAKLKPEERSVKKQFKNKR